MEKGPFSVEWLAQSSRGAARPAARRPRSPPGGAGSQESTADLGESRLSSRAGRAAGPLVAAVRLNGRRTRGRRRTAAARAAAAYVTARATRRPLREGCVMSVSCVSSSLVCPSPSPRLTATSPSCPRSRAPGPGGRGPQQQPRARSGGGRRGRARSAPHQVLGRAAAGAGAELPRAALHRPQREAAPGRRAEPLPEPGERGRGAPGPSLPSA